MDPTLSWGGGEWEGMSSTVQGGTFRALNSLALGLVQAKGKKRIQHKQWQSCWDSWARNTYSFLHKGSGAQAEAAILGKACLKRDMGQGRNIIWAESGYTPPLDWRTHFLVYPLHVLTHTKGAFASTSGAKTACVTSKVTFLLLQKTLFSSLSRF